MKWLSGDAVAVSHRLENTGDTVNANWQRRAPRNAVFLRRPIKFK